MTSDARSGKTLPLPLFLRSLAVVKDSWERPTVGDPRPLASSQVRSHLKAICLPQLSLQTAAPARILTTTSGEIPNQNYRAKPAPEFPPYRNYEIINVCVF